jgi:hypothetical protein
MQVQLLVERDQNECIVKLAGTAYKFKRNEHGHLVAEISDQETIKWVSDPINTSFRLYSVPKPKVIDVALAPPASEAALDAVVEPAEVFTCEICGRAFTTQRALKGHMGGAHKKEQG